MDSPNFHFESLVNEKGDFSDFEGPLNLLLVLLKKDKIQIRELRISDITDQYIEFVEKMKSSDLEIASEFVQMASYLVYLKTKMMLDNGSQEQELDDLMQSLEKLEAKSKFENIKEIFPSFLNMYEYGSRYYTRLPESLSEEGVVSQEKISERDFLSSVLSVISRNSLLPVRETNLNRAIPQRLLYSVREKCKSIVELLKKGPASLMSLYSICKTKSELVATFISVLELCGAGNIKINDYNGDYNLQFVGGDTNELVDSLVE